MAKLVWDAAGAHKYETGVDHGTIWVDGGNAVAWNGLTSVSEAPEGAENTSLYADNIKYLTLQSAEEFGFSINAYTYPEEFEACDGLADPSATGVVIGQQARKSFGFYYRTKVGNDQNADAGYKHHFIYGCKASPSSKDYSTVNDSPEAIEFSWEVDTTPVTFTFSGTDYTTATVSIDDSLITDATKKATFNTWLDGVTDDAADMPTPDEIMTVAATWQ